MVKDLLAADRYAAALFEIARQVGQDLEIAEELESFSAALERSPDIHKFLDNPRFKVAQKRVFLSRIYQKRQREIYEVLLNFFTVLLEKGRFHLIHEITHAFRRLSDTQRGLGVARISTAVPLSGHAEQSIVSRLERMAGYKIQVKKEIDPSLIGGVVVKLRNQVIDGSVKNRIFQFKKELTRIRMV